jgi:hypothetical protein
MAIGVLVGNRGPHARKIRLRVGWHGGDGGQERQPSQQSEHRLHEFSGGFLLLL